MLEDFLLLRKLSLRKLSNFICLGLSYQLSRMLGKAIVWGQPTTLSIEPTNLCNLLCPECPVGAGNLSRTTGSMKTDLFKRIIEEIHQNLSYLIFYFQGEPYIHPEFFNMIRYAHVKKIFTMTSTNGQFLNDEMAKNTVQSGLDSLIISIDGTTQEVYQQYRKGGELDKVIAGTRYLIEWKEKLKTKKPVIVFQFLVQRGNQHQIKDIKELGKQLGVNKVSVKTIQIYETKRDSPFLPTLSKYARYVRKNDGSLAIKNSLKNFCRRLWSTSVIMWDGVVVPCCFDKDGKYKMGNLNTDSFKSIWGGRKYTDFRNAILKNRRQFDICRNCTEGLQV